MTFSRRSASIAAACAASVLLAALAGCSPSSGSTSRSTDPDVEQGAGTASLSWDLGHQPRQPSPDEMRSLESMPPPPADSGNER